MLSLYTTVSGKQFNEYHTKIGTKFYKFLHNDSQHTLGLNIDVLPFNTSSSLEGGFYFCDESKCYLYYQQYDQKVALIEIPDDAIVYIEKYKFKADKIILTEIIDFKDMPDSFWINILQDSGNALRYIKHQTEELCKLAVQKHGNAFHYVNKQLQTDEICKLAVQQNGLALKLISNQTEKICFFAVKQNSLAIQYVNDPSLLTEDLCKLAVQQDGLTLVHIKHQTKEICTLAVKQNGLALYYVKDQTEEICKKAVQQNGLALKYVDEQFKTMDMCTLAVKQNTKARRYVI